VSEQTESKSTSRYDQGVTTRRRVLGDAHVDRAEANKTEFDAPFQQLITEAAWGHVWSRETWSMRERSIVTLALLCAQGHWEEVAMHIRATANTGATREDIQELILHLAIYTGVPTANHAIKIAKQTFAEIDASSDPNEETGP
jgi:4-carboxymuconolactone decarboxylase